MEASRIRRFAFGSRLRENPRVAIHGGHDMANGSRSHSRLWYWLLAIPYVAMIWVPSYNTKTPEWGGVPFFYWYQLLWIFIGAALTLVVYFATRDRNPS
ncbi:MAG TPA: DUF3311 domain-containing protein [Stellaceae bacterium]|nr:DUF3311 domain-containing protein [Stellaceae bacterium]